MIYIPNLLFFATNSILFIFIIILTCKALLFFMMRLGFTFLASLILKIIELGLHIILTMLLRCHRIQLKSMFGLQRHEGELLVQSSLMKLLSSPKTPSRTVYKSTGWCGSNKRLFERISFGNDLNGGGRTKLCRC
jgi:hypothetical protein